tara:strand:+ start:1434 stop:1823 length:390 start_codon:yes stop_codon:yes gene_type:complete
MTNYQAIPKELATLLDKIYLSYTKSLQEEEALFLDLSKYLNGEKLLKVQLSYTQQLQREKDMLLRLVDNLGTMRCKEADNLILEICDMLDMVYDTAPPIRGLENQYDKRKLFTNIVFKVRNFISVYYSI